MDTKVERFEVILNGEKHLMTEEQIGNLEIEFENRDDLQNIRLALARAAGVPEPELYHDSKTPPVLQGEDMEKLLDQVVEIQERMAKGMRMIQMREKYLKDLKAGYLPRISRDMWAQRTAEIHRLWTHWFKLKNQCDELVGGRDDIWAAYFQLKDGELNRYFCTGDAEAIDNLSGLSQSQADLAEDLEENHMREENRLYAWE